MSNKNKTIFQDLPKLILIVSLVIGISAVLGVTFFMIKNKPIREYGLKIITAPVPAPEIKDDTSDWKTYRNGEYGFEFKYPKDLSENTPESADAIFEATKKDDHALYYLMISIRKNYEVAQILSTKKDAKEIHAGKSIGYKYFYTEGVGASGVALIQSGQDAISITFDYIGNDPKFTAENSKMSFVQNYFDKIVNTFKFTEEKDEIADWNVYSNPEVDFTFKYPKDWEIKQDYFYTWPDGTVSDKRTVVLRRTGDNASNDWININMRQFQCDWGTCKDVLGNTIGTYSEDEEILSDFNKIIFSFNSVETNELTEVYVLDCARKPDDFQSKYFWYEIFKKQFIKDWSLDIICYNKELDKVAYLQSNIDLDNYIYDPKRISYGSSQLGIYDIGENEFEKAPIKDLGFYEGCGTILEWNKKGQIIYQCGAGDAGVGNNSKYLYDISDKTVTLIEECGVQAGRNPEEICVKK